MASVTPNMFGLLPVTRATIQAWADANDIRFAGRCGLINVNRARDRRRLARFEIVSDEAAAARAEPVDGKESLSSPRYVDLPEDAVATIERLREIFDVEEEEYLLRGLCLLEILIRRNKDFGKQILLGTIPIG